MTSEIRDLPERLVTRTKAFHGRLLDVFSDIVDLGDGRHAVREVIHHPGAAAVVALADDGRAVLVRQWRHAVGGAVWEICAGTRDEGEDFEVCARRELAEETGYTAARWTRLGSGGVPPGYSDEYVHIYLAEGLRPGSTSLDEDELVETGLFSQPDVRALIERGETDLKTIAGLSLAGWLTPATPR